MVLVGVLAMENAVAEGLFPLYMRCDLTQNIDVSYFSLQLYVLTRIHFQQACVGSKSCSIGVSSNTFGDPCTGVMKSLAVEASCK